MSSHQREAQPQSNTFGAERFSFPEAPHSEPSRYPSQTSQEGNRALWDRRHSHISPALLAMPAARPPPLWQQEMSPASRMFTRDSAPSPAPVYLSFPSQPFPYASHPHGSHPHLMMPSQSSQQAPPLVLISPTAASPMCQVPLSPHSPARFPHPSSSLLHTHSHAPPHSHNHAPPPPHDNTSHNPRWKVRIEPPAEVPPAEIIPGVLYHGSLDHALSRQTVDRLRVTHVVNVSRDNRRPFDNIQYLAYHVSDSPHSDLSPFFAQAFDFIESARAFRSDAVILVHCAGGVSRSTTVVASYLMRKERLSAREALRRIRDIHPAAQPNRGFMDQLYALERTLGVGSGGASGGAQRAAVECDEREREAWRWEQGAELSVHSNGARERDRGPKWATTPKGPQQQLTADAGSRGPGSFWDGAGGSLVLRGGCMQGSWKGGQAGQGEVWREMQGLTLQAAGGESERAVRGRSASTPGVRGARREWEEAGAQGSGLEGVEAGRSGVEAKGGGKWGGSRDGGGAAGGQKAAESWEMQFQLE